MTYGKIIAASDQLTGWSSINETLQSFMGIYTLEYTLENRCILARYLSYLRLDNVTGTITNGRPTYENQTDYEAEVALLP